MAIRVTCVGETNFKGPIVRVDAVEVYGSVLLIEPAHSANPSLLDDIVHGVALGNVLNKRAGQLGISQSSAYYYNYGLTGNSGLVERTEKGGIHGIVSQTQSELGDGAEIRLPEGVIQYLIDNSDHNIYISAWMRSTRDGVDNQPARLLIGVAENNNMLTYWYRTGIRPSSVTVIDAENTNFSGIVGQSLHQSIAVSGWAEGEVPVQASDIHHHLKWGSIGGVNYSQELIDSMPSFVFYRLYIEDLTISGRTHDEVYAVENAEYQKAFGAGGRYENDTFTDPATIV